jgi:hypothetical protein
MVRSYRPFLALVLFSVQIGPCFSQAMPQQQAVAQVDVCEGGNSSKMDASEAASCAQSAMWDENWKAFFKWGPIAAAKGDWVAASWVGDEFRYRSNYFYAYMWFDIAAQLHATNIKNLAPADNPERREDNSSELDSRDKMGKMLSKQQMLAAIAQEKNWIH